MTDSAATVRQLIDEAKVGFAPGSTFGPGGEGFLRMCYLQGSAPSSRKRCSRFARLDDKTQPA